MLGFRPRRIRLGRTNPSSPTLDFVSESTSFTKSYAPLASLKLKRSGQNAGQRESRPPPARGGEEKKNKKKKKKKTCKKKKKKKKKRPRSAIAPGGRARS